MRTNKEGEKYVQRTIEKLYLALVEKQDKLLRAKQKKFGRKNSEKQTVNISIHVYVTDDKAIFEYTSMSRGANADQILSTATKIRGRDTRRGENACRKSEITRNASGRSLRL